MEGTADVRFTALALARRSFTPLAFRPSVERLLAVVLIATAAALWFLVVPLEIALA